MNFSRILFQILFLRKIHIHSFYWYNFFYRRQTKMRVIIVSHTYITPINRKKWQILASLYPDAQLTVVFPTKWPTTLFKHKVEKCLEKNPLSNCNFVAIKSYKSGNEILYNYKTNELLQLVKSINPDIIQVEQGDNALSYSQCIILAKILRLKTKFIFFTWVNWTEKKSLKYRLLWTWIEKFNLKSSNAAIVGNHDAEVILRKKKFHKKIFVLPQLGVDTNIFKPAKKNNTELKFIGFVGRLIEEKGIFTLLNAFENLHKKYPDWKLVFLGTGQCKDMLKGKIVLKNLVNYVEILDATPHEQVAQFIQKLEIFVLPSFDKENWREQFGHVLIEAMACSIPVIGSDAGEIPNIIANTGIIFKQKDVPSLQNALESLIINEKLRKSLGENGHKSVLIKYSHEAIASKTYSIWNQIIKGKSYI